ncbi:MAG: type II toxin-antitoxin system YafQ family toxin [Prevotella sp.]|nr:type II toxin-antitoxin system YafQ family toxin [Prevotella sp.]MDY6131732.1 type II toxin-antitoxin system YafQ family toxin [Prevotella sp.]
MELKQTGQFKKDLKRYKHEQRKLESLKAVLHYLREHGKVPRENRPHLLSGEYKGCMECHVENDFLLIWIDESKGIIKLLRLGSHSELFRKY